ncbi:MAG: glycosyltransferase [Holosporaceae bacterium]|jgi:glycosyltransferase involved in cell wall biosynthesis|nr:glycosyltransferase [Holosporaceae bacterium]
MPLISAIIPVYNAEKYLCKCLNSITNQTFQDIEIICINDGSSDDSYSILERYALKDSRVKIINQENKGQAAARNLGLQMSMGKYISFVDADDWIEHHMYELLIQIFKNDLDLIIFDANVFGESDQAMRKYFLMKFQDKLRINGDIIAKCPTPPWNKIYRKDIIDKYNILFPEGLLYEDNSFHWKYMMHANNAYFLKKKLYNYMVRKGSVMVQTKSKSSKVTDHFLICLEIFEYMRKHHLEGEYGASFVDFFEHCLGIVCSYTDNLLESMKIANEIWSKIDIQTNKPIICALRQKNYNYVIKWISYRFFEKIFSIKKRYGRKIITICGTQFPDLNILETT